METTKKTVDGFRFLPPGLSAWIRTYIPDEDFKGAIPWTPLSKPLSDTTIALITSAGISLKSDAPFDMEREKNEPTWGDPSYRSIPRDTTENDIDVKHLHINTKYILQDINVMLPLARFQEFAEDGTIARLAPTSYSYYGFQLDPTILLEETMPAVASSMKKEGVEAVLLTPT